MDAEAAARAWVEAWSRGWRDHDPAVIAERYAADAVFLSHPFPDARRGKRAAFEYAEEAFAEEDRPPRAGWSGAAHRGPRR
jgi:ketosteroid isomerase-like protein